MLLVGDSQQVFAVAVVLHLGAEPLQVSARDPAASEGDFLDARDLETLPLLNCLDEGLGLEQ